MKVIFLDIDGVLNSTRSCIAYGDYPHSYETYEYFDDIAVSLIRRICTQYDVKIILSSTWRNSNGWVLLKNMLNLPIIDRTGRHMSSVRGEEIAEYLRNHPEIERYVIVDDDSDMLFEQMPFHIHTSYEDGFSYKNYLKILEILVDKKEN